MATLPDVPRLVRDAVFVSVGLGLLGVNQLQVRRRELTADLRRLADSSPFGTVLGATPGPSAGRTTGPSAGRTAASGSERAADGSGDATPDRH